MTKEEFSEKYELHENTIFLGSGEEWDVYKKAIIGIYETHIIYSYEKLVDALSNVYGSVEDAIAWIDYNIIRSIPYLPRDYAPIIIYEIEGL